ncbi:hypothetical protein SHIRM173S_09002 [Streptomyces hirsutus]
MRDPGLDLIGDGTTCVRRRRFVLDGKPVLLATSYLPMPLVAGSAITQEDTGPGGTCARLAELGYEPVHFREEIRSRMPSKDEAAQLSMSAAERGVSRPSGITRAAERRRFAGQNASLFGLAASPDLCAGGRTLQGNSCTQHAAVPQSRPIERGTPGNSGNPRAGRNTTAPDRLTWSGAVHMCGGCGI